MREVFETTGEMPQRAATMDDVEFERLMDESLRTGRLAAGIKPRGGPKVQVD